MRRAAQDIVDIGLKLIEVKGRLGHGRFLPWLEAEFGWERTTAHRFMTVAETFGSNCANLAQLQIAPSALYLLAATPEPARQEALARKAPGLLARVRAGEMTCHRACVQAGITKEPTPLDLLRRAWKKASKQERETILPAPAKWWPGACSAATWSGTSSRPGPSSPLLLCNAKRSRSPLPTLPRDRGMLYRRLYAPTSRSLPP